ncbi:MAG: hypothetical protein KatS3mg109_2224 [Pirellulaceae bacterium]|nr:MAG: hypothetical protein KatS3mg109_2224 [Pirellulaceae bacterium]GIW93211.1 MAG: hypothetical protein KatS3mg110_1252 [Pirellulaceae bacterium]
MIGACLAQRKTLAIYQAFNRHDLKAVHIQDFIFDTGANFRAARGEGG